ncbi:LAQU0S29e00232g1_1 [Lachancea quebecensis]|uniref:LAQU0S29e00232g1_1 n=1 Tax=Lachancea quebecensis TaxID=1654605 RepID=A0A0N7MMH9_9SACH|nr:LAQU0S29e00232g1_1 [Lachancea quebecensis]
MEKSPSTSFSQFTQAQIQRMRDAFQFIDDDGDGEISKEDLQKVYSNLGKPDVSEQIIAMLGEKAGELTFPEYLTVMGDRMGKLPDEEELLDALRTFSKNPGHEMSIDANELRAFLNDAGFKDKSKLDKILAQFCTTQLSGDQVFKGRKFLETLE